MKFLLLITMAGLLMAFSGCVKANVELGSQRTALENQILGSYQEIEDDVWMVASVRSSEPGKKIEMSDEKRVALESMNNRKFNKDDIDEFKESGYVGEGNRGYLVIFDKTAEILKNDHQKLKLVQDLIAEENRDRQIIMKRVIAVNENLGEQDFQRVESIFAQMNRDKEIKGNYIQNEIGAWLQKQ